MSLHVSIYIDPSNRTAFLEAFKPCFEAVRAEKECLFFEIYSDPDDAGHFSWVENWSKGVEWFMTASYFSFVNCAVISRGVRGGLWMWGMGQRLAVVVGDLCLGVEGVVKGEKAGEKAGEYNV